MLGLAVFAAQLGLAAIIGAFLAGLALADVAEDYDLERQALPLYTLLVPIFFVMTGLRVDLKTFAQPATLGLALLVTAVALVTKAVGAGLGAFGRGWRSMAVVGVGMVPRGEVGLIVATVGLAEGVVEQRLYGVVVAMSILTTLLAPPVLHWLLGPIARMRTLQPAEMPMTPGGEGISHHDTAGKD
jgi:Kef-type K+ transport system membrane component KefB